MNALDTVSSTLQNALSSFWSGPMTGPMKHSPYQRTSQEGGAGADARAFIQSLLKNATYIRFENDKAGVGQSDQYGRSLAYAIIGTPKGEINVQAELIRSGFSTDWQAFGPSVSYGGLFASAQQEAVAARRGPMWGGGPPAPVRYQVPSGDVALRTIKTLSPTGAVVVDADTFNLGPLFGEVRLAGVNALEMTTWEGIDRGPYFSEEDRLRSTGHGKPQRKGEGVDGLRASMAWLSDPLRKPKWFKRRFIEDHAHDLSLGRFPRWLGIRQQRPTNPGQFEVLKPHPEYAFPGGREQPWNTWFFDIEAQDIRTGSYTKGRYQGRGPGEPIAISQFAAIKRTPAGQETAVNYYTDLINAESVKGIKATDIVQGKPLPETYTRELARQRKVVGTQSPHWAPSVTEQGSVVEGVVRRHVRHVLEGGKVKPQFEMYKEILDEWKGMKAAGSGVELRAWNISYDLPTLFSEMRRFGLGGDLDELLSSGSIRAREMMQSVQAMQFDLMLSSNYTPVITNRAAFEAAAGQDLKNITLKDAKRLGIIQEHTGLRDMMDDIKSRSRTGFDQRVEKWLQTSRFTGEAEKKARGAVDNIWSVYNQVSDWDSYLEFTRQMHTTQGEKVVGQLSLYDIFGEIYGTKGAGHMHVLGSLKSRTSSAELEKLGSSVLAGQYSGFTFVQGGRLEDVGSFLLDNQEALKVEAAKADIIRSALGQHEGMGDARSAMTVLEEIERIRADTRLNSRWKEVLEKNKEKVGAKRIDELYQDFLKQTHGTVPHPTAAPAAGGIGKSAASKFLGHGPNWATWALAGSALWLISENNKVEKKPVEIEGARRPDSIYNSIRGIFPSDLPYSNISAFHSGYDTFDVMASTPPKGKPATPMPVSQAEAIEGSRNYYADSYTVPQASFGPRTFPPIPSTDPLSGMDHWAMSEARAAGIDASQMYAQSRLPEMRAVDGLNAQIALSAGGPSPARDHLLETFDAMGSGGDVDVGGEVARVPLGYSGARAGRFRSTGYAGYVQRLFEDSMSSRIRDQATQLRRLPGMPVTTMGDEAVSGSSHAESLAFAELGAE